MKILKTTALLFLLIAFSGATASAEQLLQDDESVVVAIQSIDPKDRLLTDEAGDPEISIQLSITATASKYIIPELSHGWSSTTVADSDDLITINNDFNTRAQDGPGKVIHRIAGASVNKLVQQVIEKAAKQGIVLSPSEVRITFLPSAMEHDLVSKSEVSSSYIDKVFTLKTLRDGSFESYLTLADSPLKQDDGERGHVKLNVYIEKELADVHLATDIQHSLQ